MFKNNKQRKSNKELLTCTCIDGLKLENDDLKIQSVERISQWNNIRCKELKSNLVFYGTDEHVSKNESLNELCTETLSNFIETNIVNDIERNSKYSVKTSDVIILISTRPGPASDAL